MVERYSIPMQRLNSEIKIAAEPQSVWKVLTDLESYQEWNSQLRMLKGRVYEGARLKISIKPLYYRSLRSSLTISDITTVHRLGFSDIHILPFGLLALDCLFTLSENKDGSTTLYLHQEYKGLLSGLVSQPARFREAKKSCIKMNAEIKRRAEQLYHLDDKEPASLSA